MKAISVLFLFLVLEFLTGRRALIWLCLERCGETEEEIENYVKVLKEVSSRSLTHISYEKYQLYPNSQLHNNGFTDVHKMLKGTEGFGGKPVKLYPMLCSGNIKDMRQLFDHPKPFVEACKKEATEHKYDGYHIDFEPESGVVESDRPKYNKFLKHFSYEMKKINVSVNVAVATWSVLWNYHELGNITKLESVIEMETYAKDFNQFKELFNQAYQDLPQSRTGIGLDSEWGLSEEEIKKRFDYIDKHDVHEVDLWRMFTKYDQKTPWWKYLNEFLEKKVKNGVSENVPLAKRKKRISP